MKIKVIFVILFFICLGIVNAQREEAFQKGHLIVKTVERLGKFSSLTLYIIQQEKRIAELETKSQGDPK